MKKIKDIGEQFMVLSFWVVLFLILWLQAVPKTHSLLEATIFPALALVSIYPFTTYLGNSLVYRVIRKKKISYFITQFVIVSIIAGAIFSGYLHLFAYLESIGVFPQSEYFQVEKPYHHILLFVSVGMSINIFICGVRFFQENIKLKRTLLEYELRTLEQQITPHFMFNVLNHINILMQEDVPVASSLLVKFSQILRYQLHNRKNGNISLAEEVQFLKDFVAIEQIRWGNELAVSSSWKIEDGKKEIPALLFIIFVENAFKHVSRGISEDAYVDIKFEQKGDIIYLEIENSKSTIQQEKDSVSGLGLDNMRKRLDILYFENYKWTIKDTDDKYCTSLTINI